MEQFKKLVGNFSTAQRASIVIGALAVGAALIGFVKWKHETDFRPLYTTLASEDAGAVIKKLKESGVEYRLSENGSSVLVPSSAVAEMRLALASAGLPKSGRIGFELFDKTNFGATEFVEHINYRRALEGELERTVMSLAEVEQARVHVTFPKESVYLESREPAKASIVVRLRPGAHLVPQNVTAVQHLVASAVEGLAPQSVSVLDVQGNLLSRTRAASSQADQSESNERLLDFRQSIERDLVAKINATLEPLLGADKFHAGASVLCDFSNAEQTEEIFDPTHSVMASSQKSEDTSNSGGGTGVPGTASNLPHPPARPAATAAGISRRTENIVYQSSRTVRHTKLPEGTIKKMSLAVVLDHDVRWEGQGKKMRRILEPPSPEKLKSIRELVAAATGFSAERGDQLIVESLAFESTRNFEPPSGASLPAGPQGATNPNLPPWLARLVENRWVSIGAALAVVLLIVAGRLVMSKLSGGKKPHPEAPPTLPAAEAENAAQRQFQLDQAADLQSQFEAAAKSSRSEALIQRLRAGVAKDAALSAHTVRGWIGESR